MMGVVAEEEFDAECNTNCRAVRPIYSLETERAVAEEGETREDRFKKINKKNLTVTHT